jgi:periplasmic divalent cation tolerance protein
MADSDAPILIMVTASGRDDAERLGEALVVERLAPSCSVVPSVHSFYLADDLLQRDKEALLLVRTVESNRDAVIAYIEKHHSQMRPEILEVRIAGGSGPYLEWLAGQVAKPGLNR